MHQNEDSQTAAKTVYIFQVSGMKNLSHLTAMSAHTRFMAFSSIAGVLGSAGQASYASANSALDVWAASLESQVRISSN